MPSFSHRLAEIAITVPLTVFHCDQYEIPLPPGHKFPVLKYRLVRELLAANPAFSLLPAPFAPTAALLRVHDAAYVQQFLDGTLPASALRRIGFPWSPGLVERTLASVGGTLAASAAALATGFGGTLAGGTHHAFRHEGAGFCVFNDIAVATEWLRRERGLARIAVVDLDVHQGDGTAAIFEGDAGVFTLSLHGARNFPFRKQRSRLDLEFPDGVGDDAYLAALAPALDEVWDFKPQLVFFQSGVDALATDRLGRLALTPPGLARRDELVIGGAFSRRIPLVVTLGGGYSEPIEQTAEAHAQTFRTAASLTRSVAADAFSRSQPQ